MNNINETVNHVVDVLFESYMNGESELTTKVLAQRLGCSPATASKRAMLAFDLDNGWRRITPTDAYIEIRDRNFGGVMREQKVPAWTITKEHLRDRVHYYRNQLDYRAARSAG